MAAGELGAKSKPARDRLAAQDSSDCVVAFCIGGGAIAHAQERLTGAESKRRDRRSAMIGRVRFRELLC